MLEKKCSFDLLLVDGLKDGDPFSHERFQDIAIRKVDGFLLLEILCYTATINFSGLRF